MREWGEYDRKRNREDGYERGKREKRKEDRKGIEEEGKGSRRY